MIGFGFSVFTQAILGLGGGFRGSALNLDFTSGNRVLDPRVTFSRTTNATLTNSAGLVANAPMNLLTFSEQFDNAAWTKDSGTVEANSAVAPNGTSTADKYVPNTTSAADHRVRQASTVTASVTYSCYVKSAGYSWAKIRVGSAWANVNLTAGTVGFNANTTNISVQSAGNGWFRCSVSGSITTSAFLYVYPLPDNATDAIDPNPWAGNGTSGIFIWGAQLELGSTATTYNPTTVKNLLGFTEHFDNAAWTKSNAFVQTNLLTYSQDFDNGTWSKGTGASVAANNAVAPDGSATADTVTFTAGGASEFLRQSVTATAGLTYTISVYARSVSGNTAMSFDLANAVSNGFTLTTSWTRYTWTVTPGSTYTWLDIQMGGAAVVEFWGAQLVQGTSAGDYKATYAAAAAVGYTDIYGQPFAQKLVENTATAEHRVQVSITFSAAPFTASTYFKAAERSFAFIRLDDSGSSKYAYFNLATGTVGTVTSGLTAFIENIGDGWYRCAARFNTPAAGSGSVIFASTTANGTNSYTGDGTSGIYIFGAQLSDSASVDPYVYNPVAAPTSTAYYGPRFDYDPVTLAPKGLLIEEQRTNLLLNSAVLNTQVVTTTATAHTLSFYGTGTIVLSGSSTGTVVGTGAYPTRTTLTFTPIVGVLTVTVTGSVTMAQLEAGSQATSYIPTAASQVTRAADSASMIGNNFARWYNVNEGTVYTQADVSVPSAVNAAVFSLGSTTSDIMRIFRQTDAQPVAQVITGGAAQATMGMGASWTTTAAQKIAFAYATNNFSATTNGGTTITDTSGTVPIVSQAVLGNAAGIGALNGHLARLAFYSRVLSSAEQKGITS